MCVYLRSYMYLKLCYNKYMAKVHFFTLTFKNLQFWLSMYKNYNFDPLKFSQFASLVLLINFDLFNAYVAGHVCVIN